MTEDSEQADSDEARAYAEDMSFMYCERCGAVVIPDGSDDPMGAHERLSHGQPSH